ncbi:lipopolysaccharide biosynthesis protein [Hwangdonia sp.]|uniref:lipopolysaccharide biosynthesis protein n=1 Tax=Hwangdonia sp. TaxID=1883432 RepID=UPI003AB1E6A4
MKFNQLKGGAALSYVIIFLTNIVGLVLTPFIIRSLGSAEYGLYTMIGALVGYMSVLDFGLNNTIVRFVAKYKAEGDKKGEENFLAHSFIMYFCISILVTVLGLILYYNLESLYSETLTADQFDKAKVMMLLLIFNLAVSLPGGAFGGICYGYEEFILPKITNIVRYVVRSILVVVILLYGADSVGLIILDTIMNLLVIAVNIYIAFKVLKVKIKLHKFDKTLFTSILGFSLWLFVFAIVHQLRWQFGQLIIGLYYSTSIVAIYAVGITLGNYYGAFSSAIESVFLPRAIQMTVKNIPKKELTATFIKISRIILIILLYILGAFVIVGKDFVYFWVGEEYYMAYYYAVIIMVGLTPILSQGFANNILEAKNLLAYRGKLLLGLTLMGTLIGIVVVQKMGVFEMIVTTVIFMLIERGIMFFYYIKKANLDMLRYYKEIFPLFINCFLIIIVGLVCNNYLPHKSIFILLLSAAIYSVLYLIGSVAIMTKYEKSLLKLVAVKTPFLRKFF